tara:strand:+ start:3111 stop:3398 length:288 start_codon:yes stop_codon:yes gene_type:complete
MNKLEAVKLGHSLGWSFTPLNGKRPKLSAWTTSTHGGWHLFHRNVITSAFPETSPSFPDGDAIFPYQAQPNTPLFEFQDTMLNSTPLADGWRWKS